MDYKISVDEVLAAKKYSRLSVVRNLTYDYLEQCGCPLTLLYCYNKRIHSDEIGNNHEPIFTWADFSYGREFREGFVDGFDGCFNKCKEDRTPLYELGELNGNYICEELTKLGEIS